MVFTGLFSLLQLVDGCGGKALRAVLASCGATEPCGAGNKAVATKIESSVQQSVSLSKHALSVAFSFSPLKHHCLPFHQNIYTHTHQQHPSSPPSGKVPAPERSISLVPPPHTRRVDMFPSPSSAASSHPTHSRRRSHQVRSTGSIARPRISEGAGGAVFAFGLVPGESFRQRQPLDFQCPGTTCAKSSCQRERGHCAKRGGGGVGRGG